MKLYVVNWQMYIDANSPEDAVRQVRELQENNGSKKAHQHRIGTHYEVQPIGELGTRIKPQRIDSDMI